MQIGEPLGDGWDIYRRFWRHLLPIAFGTYLIVAAISLGLTVALGLFGALLSGIVALVGVFLLQATLVEAVADVRDGRADLNFGETLSRGWSRVGVATGAGILAGLGILVGFVLVIVPGLYLLTFWCLIIPVVVLERTSVLDSFGRSRKLVSGHGWTVFGVLVAIEVAASIVLAIVLHGVSANVRSFISDVVVNTFVAPFIAATLTCMFFRLREHAEPAEAASVVPAGAAYRDA
jgi:hypothetical protein